ncbi:hypothetical protein ABEB36_011999 [Hypothenemus hampei]|uniref:AAA family ATPase n=1 Tax=Hypothenemus hampei TaxID=57062 RepID=A0ABD1E9R1_HYPHA
MNHILITGVPGIGKTTLVKNLVELLRQSNSSLKVNLDGFLTEEKRNQNLHRIGFQENGILVLDEIGKMELFSKKFQNAVATAFQRFNVKILATVPVKGPHFVENLKKNNNCRVIMESEE